MRVGVILTLGMALLRESLPVGNGAAPPILLLDESASVDAEAVLAGAVRSDGVWSWVGGLPAATPVVRFASRPRDPTTLGELLAEVRERRDRPRDGGDRSIGTDLEAALREAIQLAQSTGADSILVLTDGRETEGEVRGAARAALEAGIHVQVWPAPPPSGEVWIEAFGGPSRVRPGDPFVLEAVLGTTSPEPRVLETTLREGDRTVPGPSRVVLPPAPPGERALAVVEFRDSSLDPGPVEYVLTLGSGPSGNEPAGGDPRNDVARWVVEVGGERRILAFGPSGELGPAAAAIARLAPPGWTLRTGSLPVSPEDLAVTSVVLVESIPSGLGGLVEADQMALRGFVRRLGGGLVTSGDVAFYGPGGYSGSPLEAALAVRCHPDDPDGRSLLILLDRSGSMGEEDKIPRARTAIEELAGEIPQGDRLGVLTFADNPERAIGFLRATGDRGVEGVGPALRNVVPRGETDLRRAIEEGRRWILGERGERTMLVVTDGKASGSFGDLGRRLFDDGIRISALVTGQSVDERPLRELTLAGRNGAVVRVADTRALRDLLVREWGSGDLGAGPSEAVAIPTSWLGDGTLPSSAILRWARASARPDAEVAARVAATGDPLLASRRFGLGKSASFLSDPGPPSSPGWEDAALWIRVLRWAAPDIDDATWIEKVEVAGDRADVTVRRPARTTREASEDLQTLVVRVEGRSWSMTPQTDGSFEARVRWQGEEWVSIQLEDASGRLLDEARVAAGARPEILRFGPDGETLEDIARLAGGRLHRPDAPPPVSAARVGEASRFRGSAWVVAALVLLLGERWLTARSRRSQATPRPSR